MKVDNRILGLITAVVCVGILAGAWFLGAQPFVAGASAADAQTASTTSQNTTLKQQIAQLDAAQQKLPELRSELAALTAKVPDGVDGSEFLTELNSLTASTGVSLESVVLGSPTAYVPPVTATPAAAATTTTGATPSASPSTGTSTAASAASATADPNSIAPLTNGLITGTNFVIVPVNLSVTGSDAQVMQFLASLRNGDRLVLISSIDKKTSTEGAGFELTLAGSMYVLRNPASTAAAASTTDAATGTTSNG